MSRENFIINKEQSGNVVKIIPYKNGQRITWEEALEYFQHNNTFVGLIVEAMQNAPFQTFFWETPVVKLNRFFEFVMVDAPALRNIKPDSRPFDKEISQYTGQNVVVAFPNLGKDAYLVVPANNGNKDIYPHISSFIRNAPFEQILQLFNFIGNLAKQLVAIWPNLWISTSGLGVSWLHVRLDKQPKYYSYLPYEVLC